MATASRLILTLLAASTTGAAAMPELRVSDNRRFLVTSEGRPFFWLADTAWELFHRLDRDEADHYLRERAAQGFTVIQAVVLAEYGGLVDPNPYGHLPLVNLDPTLPNEAYFEHVDWICRRAGELGLRIGMLPTWGDKVLKKWGQGPEIFTPENARAYGEFLGRRYRNQAIIWINGGDRPVERERDVAVWDALAEGLRSGDAGRHLITFHPMGGHSSAEWFHQSDWLGFNMLQSGHGRLDTPNWRRIAADYGRTPVKPCLDGEPCYEDHPVNWKPEQGWFDDYDVRKAAWWAVFAGAHGHTYGCHDIWQFWQAGRQPVSAARTPWHEAMGFPGASQMQHLRRLIESRPFLTRIPDQALLADDRGDGTAHLQATRAADGSYAMVYSAAGMPFSVDLTRLSGSQITGWWYDPRTGSAQPAGELPRQGQHEFSPPTTGRGCDWALVLDDSSREFATPGT